MSLTKKIEKARAEVNKHQFGTEKWELAMVKVRALVQQAADAAPRFEHTSIEGNVWSV